MKKHLIALVAIGFVSPAMGAVIRMGDGGVFGGPDGLGAVPPLEPEVDPRFFSPGDDNLVGHTDQGPVRRPKGPIDIVPLPILDAPTTAPAPTPGLPGIDGHGEAPSLALVNGPIFAWSIDQDSGCAVCELADSFPGLGGVGAVSAIPGPGGVFVLGVAAAAAGARRRRRAD